MCISQPIASSCDVLLFVAWMLTYHAVAWCSSCIPRSSSRFCLSQEQLLSVAGGVECQTPTLSVEISDEVPRVGDHVIFTCTVSGLFSSTMTLNKVIVEPEGKMTFEPISIDEALYKPYKSLTRFKVTKTTDGEAQQLVLSITGTSLMN